MAARVNVIGLCLANLISMHLIFGQGNLFFFLMSHSSHRVGC